MQRWLVKTEPGDYGFEDLLRDRRTAWDGVTNALARRHLAAMRQGDLVLVYHSGKEKTVVGTAQVGRTDLADVELIAGQRLPRPVSLAELRSDPRLAGWELLRIPRLSVMPVSGAQWDAVLSASGRPAGKGSAPASRADPDRAGAQQQAREGRSTRRQKKPRERA